MCETNRVQQILTFKHCANNNRIFCFDIPDRCPLCEKEILKRDVDNTDEIEFDDDDHSIKEIKSLPNPLKAANKSKCALAIRPTKGDFLSDYKNTSDLHICLTMSDGKIVEFDDKGARVSEDGNEWQSCLIINMFDYLPAKINNHWDIKLREFIANKRWAKSEYHSADNNCFDFVLEFLRSLNMKQFETSIESKTKFCETFIVPRTKLLARYISLFRKIRSDGFVILGMNK
ncbi:MKRN2 opposite strand protein-like [Dermatophagoides pteronyssinus]|uniref:MKRN2 opposite strand protein-like n=1 Tax=Dermatophagoides pteronyssinus TaxID=6956 RepID=UPI003F667BD3